MAEWTPAQRAAAKRILDRAATRTRREEVEEDVETHRTRTPEECDQALRAVVRATHRILLDIGDPERFLAPDEPPAPDFARIWRAASRRAR